jgi:pimeloyl-ACP methyl ester carboxylesterase
MAIAITAGGARIAWDAFGNAGQPALLLIQGLGAQMIGWRPEFCQRLADQGFHVIRFDNRDVGLSEHYPEKAYQLADLADDTAALLDALKIDAAHIVGQSMGGLVAQLLWQRHPSRVRSLGLVYTAASLRHARGQEDIADRTTRPIPGNREEFMPYYVAGESLCASPGYAQDVAWLEKLGGEMWDRSWEPTGAMRQLNAVFTLPDLTGNAKTISVPTALIAGDGDRLIDHAGSVELHQLISGATLRIFPGMGHELPPPLWSEIARILADNARVTLSSKEH